MVDLRNFLRNTDYPTDQIVGFLKGEVTVPNNDFRTVDFPHPLGVKVLPVSSWSPTADFDISYPAIPDLVGNGARPSVAIQANESVVRVVVTNFTGAARTIHWRSFFLLPSNVDPDVEPTAILSLPLTYSTDYNYRKLFKEDYVTSSQTIAHDLNYRPQVKLWGQYANGFIGEYIASDAYPTPTSDSAEVTTSSLILGLRGTYAGIHYRIYGDQQ